MFSPTKMIFFLHLFPVLRIIFNVLRTKHICTQEKPFEKGK